MTPGPAFWTRRSPPAIKQFLGGFLLVNEAAEHDVQFLAYVVDGHPLAVYRRMHEVRQPRSLLGFGACAGQVVDPAAGFFGIVHAVEGDQPPSGDLLVFGAKVDLVLGCLAVQLGADRDEPALGITLGLEAYLWPSHIVILGGETLSVSYRLGDQPGKVLSLVFSLLPKSLFPRDCRNEQKCLFYNSLCAIRHRSSVGRAAVL